MFLAGRKPHENDIVHHHQPRQIGARQLRERTAVIAWQLAQIPSQLHGVTDIEAVVLNNRGKNGESVGVAADVAHLQVPTGAMPVDPRSAPTLTWKSSHAFSNAAG